MRSNKNDYDIIYHLLLLFLSKNPHIKLPFYTNTGVKKVSVETQYSNLTLAISVEELRKDISRDFEL